MHYRTETLNRFCDASLLAMAKASHQAKAWSVANQSHERLAIYATEHT